MFHHPTTDTDPAGPSGTTARPVGDPPRQGSPGGADAPPNSTDGDAETVSRAEFEKVVAQRQAAKRKARALAAEVEQLRRRLEQLDEGDLEAYRLWKQASGREDVPAGQQGLDIQAIASTARDPLQRRIEQLTRQKEALREQLADLLRDHQLRLAAARADAINPEQVVALLRGRVHMTETPDGRFVPVCTPPEGACLEEPADAADVGRFVAWFLAQPENANLLRASVTPGSGARQAGGAAENTEYLPRSRAEFLSLDPAERRAVAARMSRDQRDALLGRGPAGEGGYI